MFDDIPRGVPGRRAAISERTAGENTTPQSRFASIEEIAARQRRGDELAYAPSTIFLGMSDDEPVGYDSDQHMTLVAGSRSGKGRNVLIPTLIGVGGDGYRGSVICTDPKGELANTTALSRAEMGQWVGVFDPFGITGDHIKHLRRKWNVQELLSHASETTIDDAALIADSFVLREDRDAHFDETALTLLIGLILFIAFCPMFEGKRDLITLRNVLMKGLRFETGERDETGKPVVHTGFDGLLEAMDHWGMRLAQDEDENIAAIGDVISGTAIDMLDKPDREQGSVLSTARRHTKFLDSKALRNTLRGHDVDLTELKTHPHGMTLYLVLPAARMTTHNRFLRLFINLMLEAMEREPVKPKIPVLMMLDEFPVLGHMRQIEAAAGQIAGFGVRLLTVVQDLTQLQRHYKESWETFLGNSGAVVAFGNSDNTTLEWLSKRLGQTTLITYRSSQVSQAAAQSGATGASWSPEVQDLMKPEEIGRFFGRNDRHQRMLVIQPGQHPMILQRIKYDLHPACAGRFWSGGGALTV